MLLALVLMTVGITTFSTSYYSTGVLSIVEEREREIDIYIYMRERGSFRVYLTLY